MAELDYFPWYNSYLTRTAKLTDEELGRLVRALCRYNATQEPQELSGREELAYDFIVDDIDRARANYMERCRQNAENGARGGRPKNRAVIEKPNGFEENRKNQTVILETEKSQSESKSKSKSESKSNITTPNGVGGARARRFTPPTLAEVQSYVAERHSPVEPQAFLDFYESKGWMVGKTPMKDWKAACRNAEKWERWARRPLQRQAVPDYEKFNPEDSL